MKTNKPNPIFIWSTCLIVSILSAGCSVHSVHDLSYVSDSIEERSGRALLRSEDPGVFKLPADVSLEDGLTAEEAVAISL